MPKWNDFPWWCISSSSVCIMLAPSHQILLAANGAKHASVPHCSHLSWSLTLNSSLSQLCHFQQCCLDLLVGLNMTKASLCWKSMINSWGFSFFWSLIFRCYTFRGWYWKIRLHHFWCHTFANGSSTAGGVVNVQAIKNKAGVQVGRDGLGPLTTSYPINPRGSVSIQPHPILDFDDGNFFITMGW